MDEKQFEEVYDALITKLSVIENHGAGSKDAHAWVWTMTALLLEEMEFDYNQFMEVIDSIACGKNLSCAFYLPHEDEARRNTIAKYEKEDAMANLDKIKKHQDILAEHRVYLTKLKMGKDLKDDLGSVWRHMIHHATEEEKKNVYEAFDLMQMCLLPQMRDEVEAWYAKEPPKHLEKRLDKALKHVNHKIADMAKLLKAYP